MRPAPNRTNPTLPSLPGKRAPGWTLGAFGARWHRGRPNRGMTLVEVMVGTTLLAMLATSLVALFVQNFRMSKMQAFRSQAVTTSLTILEQLRFMKYPQVESVYNAVVKDGSGAFTVQIVNPAVDLSSATATDYSALSLPVNVLDGTLKSADWTTANIVVDPDLAKPRLPMRFFLTLKRNRQTSGTKVDVFEVVLLYQYLNQGRGTSNWLTGNVRLIVPSLNSIN